MSQKDMTLDTLIFVDYLERDHGSLKVTQAVYLVLKRRDTNKPSKKKSIILEY